MTEIRLGIAGLGVVSQGLLSIIKDNAELIFRRTGVLLRVVHVASRSAKADVDLLGANFSLSLDALWQDPSVDVVVELIGGIDDAKKLIQASLANGKRVATANKAVIALHGDELIDFEAPGRLKFEASVAGSIPIVQLLQKSLVANRFGHLIGIINGTCNYILTAMEEKSLSFDEALSEAQKLGFAEADPTFDVEGIDAAHKLTILLSLAFGVNFDFKKIHVEGITSITEEDINYAAELGYRIKHLGIIKSSDEKLEARVHPTLIQNTELLANVLNEKNAILVRGDASGDMLFAGPGAGSLPTASAVVSDLVGFGLEGSSEVGGGGEVFPLPTPPQMGVVDVISTSHYLRIPSEDKPGIFAKIAGILSSHGISIEAVIQKEAKDSSTHVSIVILTNQIIESIMIKAVSAIQELREVSGEIVNIRVENMS